MKKIFLYTTVIFAVFLSGCEKVIDVDLNTAAPRLVVDAAIVWLKGTDGSEQKIKLTMTTSFYNELPPTVSGATVFIKNSEGFTYDFLETPNTGEYVCSTFVPILDETYVLTVNYNGQTLTATEILKPVTSIDYVAQEVTPGIGEEEDQIEVKTFFTDPENSNDFYMFRFQASIMAVPEFGVSDDEFFQGNQIFGIYQNENLKPGDILGIRLYGISEQYYNYMSKLLNAIGGNGPFSTTPGTLRGNIVNTTNPDNFVLGYFSLSEIDSALYTVTAP
jgi:hypothetical protein